MRELTPRTAESVTSRRWESAKFEVRFAETWTHALQRVLIGIQLLRFRWHLDALESSLNEERRGIDLRARRWRFAANNERYQTTSMQQLHELRSVQYRRLSEICRVHRKIADEPLDPEEDRKVDP